MEWRNCWVPLFPGQLTLLAPCVSLAFVLPFIWYLCFVCILISIDICLSFLVNWHCLPPVFYLHFCCLSFDICVLFSFRFPLIQSSLRWSIDPACPFIVSLHIFGCFTCIFVAFHFVFVFCFHLDFHWYIPLLAGHWTLPPVFPLILGCFFLHLRYHLLSAGISQWTMLGICIIRCSDHKVGYLFCKYRSKVESSGVGQR